GSSRLNNKQPRAAPYSNSNRIDAYSVIDVQVSHNPSKLLLQNIDEQQQWTPSPVKNVSYADQSMVRVEEQHEQRRELRELLVTESKAWRIGAEPEFVSTF
ncbi:MAG: hypothetical protein SGARI_000899, partial [Bacillariaceae sp.]